MVIELVWAGVAAWLGTVALFVAFAALMLFYFDRGVLKLTAGQRPAPKHAKTVSSAVASPGHGFVPAVIQDR